MFPALLLAITFTQDVAPILRRRCASCHRPGESAPFSLLSYSDAAPRAAMIAKATASRYMPPWLPAPGPPKFQNERRLTAAEIQPLQRWARSGALEGTGAAPAPTASQPTAPADLTVTVPSPYSIPADGPD